MIIPMNNGRTITPIYIPQPIPITTTNPGVLQQSNVNTQYHETSFVDWVVLGVVSILLIAFVIYFVKLLKYFFGGEDE